MSDKRSRRTGRQNAWRAPGIASRRDAERLVAEGRVKLNSKVLTHPATFVDR